MATPTLFTSFIKLLGVPHTVTFSNREYKSYPPKLAFMAFQDLLYEYKVGRKLVTSPEPTADALKGLQLPCVVQNTDGSPMVVTTVSDSDVSYLTASGPVSASMVDFLKLWNGKAIEATRTSESAEPDWRKHSFLHFATVAEHYVFWILLVALCAYFYVSNGLYSSWSLTLLTVLYAFGLAASWMLTLKQNNVHSESAEAVCSMIEPHGCNTVVNSPQGTFLGLFHWSEIGLTFFTVSLGTLLLHPQSVNYLAYISILCLPYSFWSVYTQKFKIHSWCTLCLTVQTLFWIIFGICLGGGHLHHLFPLHWDLAVMLACYGLALLFYHKIVPAYFSYELQSLNKD